MSSLIALTPGNYRFMRITILWYICCSETDMRSEEDSAEHSDEQSPQCFMVFAILVQLMFHWFDDGINTSTTSAVRTSAALSLCNAIRVATKLSSEVWQEYGDAKLENVSHHTFSEVCSYYSPFLSSSDTACTLLRVGLRNWTSTDKFSVNDS